MPQREKTALVLSGGGVFAAYQAGAWNVIRAAIKPDLLIGVSAGALNAWAIASRCSAASLQDRWLDPRPGAMLCRKWPTASAPSFFDDDRLSAGIRQWTAAFRPCLPLGVVLLKLPSLSRRVVRTPNISAAHLRASCAVPGMFSPVRVDGGLHCDAAVLDAVNLWAAGELGATSIIAVDVMPGMPFSFMQGAMGFALSAVRGSTLPRNAVRDTLVLRPSRPLGSAASMLSWDPVRVRDWIRLGEDDAADCFLGNGLRLAA